VISTPPRARLRVPSRPVGALLAAALLALAGCDGENLFRSDVRTQTGADRKVPTVELRAPLEASIVAIGDTVRVMARVTDNRGIASVEFAGFALRGDASLGTQTRVDRFETRVVRFDSLSGRVVKDTVLVRDLVPKRDSLPDRRVLVVATARDSSGNVAADTVQISLGGPRVRITTPVPDSVLRAGGVLTVRLSAEDLTDRIGAVRLRTSGAFARDTTLRLALPATRVDTAVVLAIPANVQGDLSLDATATSTQRNEGTARTVRVRVAAAAADVTPPRVSFSASIPQRMEVADTVSVTVTGADEMRVDTLGATVRVVRRTSAGEQLLGVLTGKVAVAPPTGTQTLRLPLGGLGLSGMDTLTTVLEVVAFAKDAAGNCATATAPNTVQSLPCRSGAQGATVSDGPGALSVVFLARGETIPLPETGDVIADLVADSGRVYLSNRTRNRLEVLPVGARTFGPSVRVGSEPWGLALGRNRDTLFVANSGGTNISLVPLRGATLQEDQGARIFTRNEQLFNVLFDTESLAPSSVTRYDYSDRPQFIAQASNGSLVYSTKPTGAAPDGTVRIYNPRQRAAEIVTGYVSRHSAGRAIVVNADSTFLVAGEPKRLLVCPRRRPGDTADPACIVGNVEFVHSALEAMRRQPPNQAGGRYDTRMDVGADIEELGLSDTTFVAASTNRQFIAVGEGARTQARIPLFQVAGDTLKLQGDVRDLINNTNERVIGLGLNADGSLGTARGTQVYFFDRSLRLQGVTASGTPTGGVAMHPENAGYPEGSAHRQAFISGVDERGIPYIDVIDTFNFFRVSRLFLRDPVTGALAVAPRAASDPPEIALRIYAVTRAGVVGIRVAARDLQ
jgi:hypothetical protein